MSNQDSHVHQGHCAHLNVSWKTRALDGGLARGWWECVSCARQFVPSDASANHSRQALQQGFDALRGSAIRLQNAAEDLIGFVRTKYPGERLQCPYMQELAAATGMGDPPETPTDPDDPALPHLPRAAHRQG